jgi:hypothetical protein
LKPHQITGCRKPSACLTSKVGDACVEFGQPSAGRLFRHHLPIERVTHDGRTAQQRSFDFVAELFKEGETFGG